MCDKKDGIAQSRAEFAVLDRQLVEFYLWRPIMEQGDEITMEGDQITIVEKNRSKVIATEYVPHLNLPHTHVYLRKAA